MTQITNEQIRHESATELLKFLSNVETYAAAGPHDSMSGWTNKIARDADGMRYHVDALTAALAKLNELEEVERLERSFICRKCGLRQDLGERTEPTF